MKALRNLTFVLALVLGQGSWAATPQEEIQKLYDSVVDQSPVNLGSLSEAQRNALFQAVANHPVAGLRVIDRYDHQPTGIGNGEVGFCYGRAMAVHLLARKMGLRNESIQKIFIAGDLNNGEGVRWRFHMATMVKGDDGEFYVIDPIMPSMGQRGVLSPYTWMQTIKDTFDLRDGKDQSHFFVTDTRSIMVDMRVVPAHAHLEIQDRLIEPSFDPEGREGFTRVKLRSDANGPFPVYQVTGASQERYFTLREEAPVAGVKANEFDFFSISLVILYQPEGARHVQHLPRAYFYNNYFVDLVKSVIAPSQPEAEVRSLETTERKGPQLYGFGPT